MNESAWTARDAPGWPDDWPYPPGLQPERSRGGMVSTTDQYATEVGRSILARGGNAVDAAVAVSCALAVVNPEAGNLAGGGFMLLRTADGEVSALDYRSRAPAAATPDMFAGPDGPDDRAVTGHLAVAVPGSVRGLWEAHGRFGSLPWGDLVEPSVALARGFQVRERFVRSFEPHIIEGLSRFASSAGVFLPGGAPPRVGDTFSQPDLAATLERIRDHGADGFYMGETADLFVEEMRRGGGVVDRDDLRSYTVAWREPVRFDYRGHTILSMPPSSSGGVTLAAMGTMLSRFPLGELPWHGARHIHLLAEAWKRAFVDRNHHLADPDFVDSPLATLTSQEYGAQRAGTISLDRATPASDIHPGAVAARGGDHTTHISIVDGQGNAASVTTTLNTWYGSKLVAEGTGVLLNNEMDDFAARPGEPELLRHGAGGGERDRARQAHALHHDPHDGAGRDWGAPDGGGRAGRTHDHHDSLPGHRERTGPWDERGPGRGGAPGPSPASARPDSLRAERAAARRGGRAGADGPRGGRAPRGGR